MNCFPEFCEPNQQINKPKEGITYTYLISTQGHILRFLDSILKSRDITLPPKIWCFEIVALEKTLEHPLDNKEIKPVNPKGNQAWIFIGRTDAEAEAPILWPPGAKSWLIGKDPDIGKGWKQEKKGMTEDEMVGWRHWLNGHEFEQTLGNSEGQGSLVCWSPWGHKESDRTEWLNN